jgi:hypothetical protein
LGVPFDRSALRAPHRAISILVAIGLSNSQGQRQQQTSLHSQDVCFDPSQSFALWSWILCLYETHLSMHLQDCLTKYEQSSQIIIYFFNQKDRGESVKAKSQNVGCIDTIVMDHEDDGTNSDSIVGA